MPLKSNTPHFTPNCCHNPANSLHGVALAIVSEVPALKLLKTWFQILTISL